MNLGLNTMGAGASGLSLVRILGSISKTVGIVRQFAPIYRDVKPLLEKAPAFFQKLNSMRNSVSDFQRAGIEFANKYNSTYSNNLTSTTTEITTTKGPVFFQ